MYGETYTVEPLNKGHLGTQAVVPYLEVCVKTILLSADTALDIDNEVQNIKILGFFHENLMIQSALF